MTIEQAQQQAKQQMIEYNRGMAARQDAVRKNAGLRMAGKSDQQVPVPPKPTKPMAMICYGLDGSYEGRIWREEDCPADCTIKMEPVL